jgi:hypothetical protein
MKLSLRIAGVILALMGAVWFLQGLSVLGGGFMVGQTRWVVNGAIAVVIGLGLVAASRQRRPR